MNLNVHLKQAPRGTARRVAREVGVTPVTLSQWAGEVKPTPVERCPAIECSTSGAVTCEEQRPDVRWVRVPDPAWPWHPKGRPLIDVAAAAIDRYQEQGAQGQQSPAAGTSLGEEAASHQSMAGEPQHAQPRAA